MIGRLVLFFVPATAVVGLVLLLNGLQARPGVAAASLGLAAVGFGSVVGYIADRLPGLPGAKRRRRRLVPHHVD